MTIPLLWEDMATRHGTVLIFGANTDVGKTVIAAGLALAGLRLGLPTSYLKPVQTGINTDVKAVSRYASDLTACDSLYAWARPVSPHVAALDDCQAPPSAEEVSASIGRWLRAHADSLCLVETAGGVLSPTPDGCLQADIYATHPWSACLLVGDARLGGISTTLCARESLNARGVMIDGVAFVGQHQSEDLGNADFLSHYAHVTRFLNLPPETRPLDTWLVSSAPDFDRLLSRLLAKHRNAQSGPSADLM